MDHSPRVDISALQKWRRLSIITTASGNVAGVVPGRLTNRSIICTVVHFIKRFTRQGPSTHDLQIGHSESIIA